MSRLFSSFTLRGVTLRNRIAMSPMCMYSAGEDGSATDWHLAHLAARAIGGVGLIITEATAVEPRGRISPNDLGLWSDAQIESLARIVRLCQSQGAAMCSQLAHAGRKAWSATKGQGPTTPVAPSAIPFDRAWSVPQELSQAEIEQVVSAFRLAAQRALAVGMDAVEIHAAHGYLLHEFLANWIQFPTAPDKLQNPGSRFNPLLASKSRDSPSSSSSPQRVLLSICLELLRLGLDSISGTSEMGNAGVYGGALRYSYGESV